MSDLDNHSLSTWCAFWSDTLHVFLFFSDAIEKEGKAWKNEKTKDLNEFMQSLALWSIKGELGGLKLVHTCRLIFYLVRTGRCLLVPSFANVKLYNSEYRICVSLKFVPKLWWLLVTWCMANVLHTARRLRKSTISSGERGFLMFTLEAKLAFGRKWVVTKENFLSLHHKQFFSLIPTHFISIHLLRIIPLNSFGV